MVKGSATMDGSSSQNLELPKITEPKSQAVAVRKRSRKAPAVVALVVCLLAAGGSWYYFATKDIETTDDAQVDGNAIAIAPKVGGYVVTLNVGDNQRVKAGDLLLKIDPRDYLVARDQANAALSLAKAALENARINLATTKISAPAKLVQAKAQVDQAVANRDLASLNNDRQIKMGNLATTQQSKDQAYAQLRTAEATLADDKAQVDIANLVAEAVSQAQAQVDQAQAQMQQAQAQLDTAELNLGYTEIRAPQDGWVTTRNVQQGSFVQAGQSLLSLVTPDVWITANFKESQLDRMHIGQKVDIDIDAYGHLRLKGHIDSIQLGTGSRFSAFPAENATGNFVKIVQRVPVKIVVDSGLDPSEPLPLGASADPTVFLQ
jgi:membrane fusion protein (multidrug efflux system)